MSNFEVIQIETGGFDHNFSYLIFAKESNYSAIVDPCGDISLIERAIKSKQKIKPAFILLTHSHFDHVSGVIELKEFFDAPVAAHKNNPFPHQISLDDFQRLNMGRENLFIEAIHAPGHTDDGVIYRLSDDSGIFTGDTLFIDYIGYCNARKMFSTLQKIKNLKGTNIVYSGHNYGSVPYRSLEEEILKNPFLRPENFHQFEDALKNLS